MILLQYENIQPEGFELLYIIAAIVLISLAWILLRKRKKTAFSRFRIIFEQSPKDKTEAYVKIENSGNVAFEINAPEIIFVGKSIEKSFVVKSNKGDDAFPLYLFPKTFYDFRIDFNKFYEREPVLASVKRLKIKVKGKNGKLLESKSVELK